MKKYMIAVGSMLVISSGICSAMSAQQVKKDFESAIKSAFKIKDRNTYVSPLDHSPFYDSAFDSNAVNACYKAAANIKSFVDSHSKNLVGMKDNLLNNTAAQLERILMDTINNIKVVRGIPFAKADAQMNIFNKLSIDCTNAKSALEKENFTIADKKEAKDVLLFALDIIRNDLIATAKDSARSK